MKTYILPYKASSESAKALANALDIKRIKLENSKFKPKGKRVINWGCSSIPEYIKNSNAEILNADVSLASCKKKFFMAVAGNEWCIPFYLSKEEAIASGKTIVCRTILNGHSGAGIVIAENPEEIVDAPLYTEYIKKEQEYRIHVFDGNIIFEQRKARNKDVEDDNVNWQVRNHANGFIYSHQGVDVPECVQWAAIASVQAVGLCFGAADVLYNAKQNKAYVLEVNTAPGLSGPATLEAYVKAIKELDNV